MKPIMKMPDNDLFRQALNYETPCLVYDINSIKYTIQEIQNDLSKFNNSKLNFAIKACHTLEILEEIAKLGLGADVASIGEYFLAKKAGFSEISATGPSFTSDDFSTLYADGTILDVNSVDQLQTLNSELEDLNEVGLRIRIPLPSELDTDFTFGKNSRFGIYANSENLINFISTNNIKVTRLHVHTGQTTPESLLFKVKYLLKIAEIFPEVNLIDLGGGLFHLFANRKMANKALSMCDEYYKKWAENNRRSVEFRFEPGAALLAQYGYLFTEVLSTENHEYYNCSVVTVDASCWNLSPWQVPQVLFADPDIKKETEFGLIAGSTLYELDFFGQGSRQDKIKTLEIPVCKKGDKLVITSAGAYTMTNSRNFNKLNLPQELIYEKSKMVKVS